MPVDEAIWARQKVTHFMAMLIYDDPLAAADNVVGPTIKAFVSVHPADIAE
jgi:hypothetical protein